MATKTIKSGNASVNLDQDMSRFFLDVLRRAAPEAEKIMSEAFEQIERDAKQSWPKRRPVRKFRGGKVIFVDESKNSWNQFERGARVDSQGNLVVYLKNTAPYSYVIKFGQDSRNKDGKDIIQPQGKRAAQELLIKPLNKSTRRIVKALADELFKGR